MASVNVAQNKPQIETISIHERPAYILNNIEEIDKLYFDCYIKYKTKTSPSSLILEKLKTIRKPMLETIRNDLEASKKKDPYNNAYKYLIGQYNRIFKEVKTLYNILYVPPSKTRGGSKRRTIRVNKMKRKKIKSKKKNNRRRKRN